MKGEWQDASNRAGARAVGLEFAALLAILVASLTLRIALA